MNTLMLLDSYGARVDDQLWYVAHPVHPTDEDVAAYRAREDEVFAYYRALTIGRFQIVGDARHSDREVRMQINRDNIASAKAWLAWLVSRFPRITFIMPWVVALDGGGDDDLDPEHRERGLRDCCRTVRACSGIVLVGGRTSDGMRREAAHAARTIDLTFLGRLPPTTSEATQ